MAYITLRVKLEIGACGDPRPAEKKVIRPYAADDFPHFFEDADATVTVLSARRTFWEKAHRLARRGQSSGRLGGPQYFSRHYHDLAMLLDSDEGKAAVADLELLTAVEKHKATFFRSGWANYGTARPGTLRLKRG